MWLHSHLITLTAYRNSTCFRSDVDPVTGLYPQLWPHQNKSCWNISYIMHHLVLWILLKHPCCLLRLIILLSQIHIMLCMRRKAFPKSPSTSSFMTTSVSPDFIKLEAVHRNDLLISASLESLVSSLRSINLLCSAQSEVCNLVLARHAFIRVELCLLGQIGISDFQS